METIWASWLAEKMFCIFSKTRRKPCFTSEQRDDVKRMAKDRESQM